MKPRLKIICALLLAGAVAGTWVQRSALSKMRADNQLLREQSRETQRLAGENANLDRLREEIREVEQLRNETRELHKLRNEVRQLRERKSDLAKLRAQNQQLRARTNRDGGPTSRAADARPLVTKELLADAGWSSPEAALETFFWAFRERNAQKIRACFSDEPDVTLREQTDEQVLAGDAPLMATFKGFQIVARKVVSADEIKLGFRVIQSTAQGESVSRDSLDMALPFKRVGNEWKIGVRL